MISLETVQKLLALAGNSGATRDERETAAMFACRGLRGLGLLDDLPTREWSVKVCADFAVTLLAPSSPEPVVTPKSHRVGLCDLCGTRIRHVHASRKPVYDFKTGSFTDPLWDPNRVH